MNGDNFKLIEELGEVYIEPTIKIDKLNDLLTYNINQDNIYEILLIADFYQYKRMEELIEKIQILILDGKIKIEYEKLKKEDLYNSICINECLREGKIKCDLDEKIHNVCCVKYLESKGYECDIEAINWAAHNGYIDTIKYLEKYNRYKKCKGWIQTIEYAACGGQIEIIKYLESQGYIVTKKAVIGAARNGHLEIIKYLESKKYEIEEDVINYAAQWGQIEIIKYLESLGYRGNKRTIIMASGNGQIKTIEYLESIGYEVTKHTINSAAYNGHIETIKYLESKGYKGTEEAINLAAENGNMETIKYLESQGYKGNNKECDTIYIAAKNGYIETVRYLIEKKYNFTICAINSAKTKEIKNLLKANKELMIK